MNPRRGFMDETIKSTEAPLRLCLGGGSCVPDGFVNVDREVGKEAYPLDYPDDSVDEVYASHILEHFSHRETMDVLKEWVRVLKPGGVMRIAVPDLGAWAHRYVEHRGTEEDLWVMFGAQTDESNYHKTGFDRNGLTYALRMAGLVNIGPWVSKNGDCAERYDSLNLLGMKPDRKVLEAQHQRRVYGVLTAPRVGFTDNMHCVASVFRQLDIPLYKVGGAYFDQGMDRAMDAALENEDADYVLTLDYDTIFNEDSVIALMTLMERYPEADAIVPSQVKREDDTVLVNIEPEYRALEEINKHDIVPIRMGHFGLSIFRASSLRKFKKPWFVGKPGPSGAWDDGRTDADVNFWNLFRDQGFKPYMACNVAIGHLQVMCTWPSMFFTPVHQHMSEYTKHGRPPQARH